MQNHVAPQKLSARDADREVAPRASQPIDYEVLIGAAQRQAFVLIFCLVASIAIAATYLHYAAPEYTAVANLLIDSQKDKNALTASVADLTFDTSAIDSQVEILKSEKIALAVGSTLKLAVDPEFVDPPHSFVASLLARLRGAVGLGGESGMSGSANDQLANTPERRVVARLKSQFDVRRIARTYVLALSYTSTGAVKAAAVANAFAEAYINDQMEAKFEATRRAATWMESRLSELKDQSLESDLAVQKFKATHGIVVTGGDKPGLISDQQLTELSGEIVTAHSETARAEARYAQIQELLKSGRPGLAVPDSLSNPVINDMRGRFLTASKTESQLEGKLGPQHAQVIALKHEMDEYNQLIYQELQRIAESYRSEAEVAMAKEKSLTGSMSSLVGQSAITNETLVQLRQLQRESDTYRSLYESFLQRYQQALQQQSFPETEARVITAASTPRYASYPKSSLIMALSVILGGLVGASVGGVREYRDQVFRVASHVRNELGLEFLGMLEKVQSKKFALSAEAPEAERRLVRVNSSIQRYSIDHPLTGFCETLRAAKVAVDLALGPRRAKIVGIISVLPNEGKSTVSKNLASLLAHLGARTLLIDGDLRNPGLTRNVARHAEAGLLEALRRERPMEDYLLSEPDSGLVVLPAVVKKRVVHSSEIIASAAMRTLLAEASEHYEYILVDLPPLGPVIDVRAACSQFDAFIFVAEWGNTPRIIAQNMLNSDRLLYEKCVGFIYNKVNLNRVNQYDGYGSRGYYYVSPGKYYENEKASETRV